MKRRRIGYGKDGRWWDGKRTRKWHKKLRLNQILHIQYTTKTGSLVQFKENLAFEDEFLESRTPRRSKHGRQGIGESCWECHEIAERLGIVRGKALTMGEMERDAARRLEFMIEEG